MKQSTENISGNGGTTRREFIKKSTLATAAVAITAGYARQPVYGQNQAPSPGRVIGANDRINVAYVGVGLQGMAHLTLQKQYAGDNNVSQVAVCDLSKYRQAQAKDAVGAACLVYEDYRKLLENKDIDAITVSTTDPWHATIAMDAVQAGKHVYGEKPMARYLGEAFKLYDAVKNSKCIFQIGSQGTSDTKWKKVAELVGGGKLGKLILGQDSYNRNSVHGEWNDSPYDVPKKWLTSDPTDVNWDVWQQLVKNKEPFSQERYVRWRKYYPYCAGPLGDLCPHRMHPLMMATGNPEFPSRVVCLGRNPVHADTDVTTEPNRVIAPERDCPEELELVAEFPSGVALMMVSSTVTWFGLPPVMRTHKATLLISGDRVEVKPEKEYGEDIDPQTYDNLLPGEEIFLHEKNWFECIRSGKEPNGNIDLAIKVQTVLSLAEMSNRLNMVCLFDGKTRTITNGDGKEVPAISYGTLAKS